ncbi:MAG: ComF family protein [Cellulosilyticum sp.]|nr:ComF family protein [Cellulosilyticum sp.]
MQILQSFLGYFYPNKCMLCRSILSSLDDSYICRLCYGDFKDKYGNKKSNIDDRHNQTTKVITLFPYESIYRKAILRWKYGGYRKYAKGFAKLLVEEQLAMPTENAVLVPIPLAPSRMKKRGYNQALDLAAEISKLTDIPVLDCLRRTHDTKPQVACTKEERYTNAKNSMKCIDDKSAKKINTLVLIDDIYTTGSTIREAIRVIKRQYIFRDAHIYAVVVGKGTL